MRKSSIVPPLHRKKAVFPAVNTIEELPIETLEEKIKNLERDYQTLLVRVRSLEVHYLQLENEGWLDMEEESGDTDGKEDRYFEGDSSSDYQK